MNKKKTFIRDFSFRINDTSFKKSFVAQKMATPLGVVTVEFQVRSKSVSTLDIQNDTDLSHIIKEYSFFPGYLLTSILYLSTKKWTLLELGKGFEVSDCFFTFQSWYQIKDKLCRSSSVQTFISKVTLMKRTPCPCKYFSDCQAVMPWPHFLISYL